MQKPQIPEEYWPMIAQQILAEMEKQWRTNPTYILMTWFRHG
jgi:hypothetical protein